MNETCDRCGPAVRAAYHADRDGELHLCAHEPAVGGSIGARLGHLANQQARTRAASRLTVLAPVSKAAAQD